MIKDVIKNFKQHCMSGISYMIPVIVIGGFCTAIARLVGGVDIEGSIGYSFLAAGNAAFALMVSVLCAGIAYSICGKPGIAPGVVAGYLATNVKAGCFNLMDARAFPKYESFKVNVSNSYLSSYFWDNINIIGYVCIWTSTCSINTMVC